MSDAVFSSSKIEQIWAVFYFGSDKYLAGCIYKPKDFVDINDLDLIFKQAKKYVDEKDLLIMGDFNFPSIGWSNFFFFFFFQVLFCKAKQG